MDSENKGEVLIYQSEDGLTHIDVKMEDETVWLTQLQLCELYQTSKSNVSEHIKHILRKVNLMRIQLFGNSEQLRLMVIYERADAEKPYMGLTSFSGEHPLSKDIGIAKNYLQEDELKILNNLVSGYFDFAEVQAMRRNPMYMNDYIEHLDNVLSSTGEKLLVGSGKVSHTQALKKAKEEYRKYQAIEITPVEQAYLNTIKDLEKTAKKKSRNN